MTEDNNIQIDTTPGAKPITPPLHEQFVAAVFQGVPKARAYLELINPRVTARTASSGASRLLQRSEVAARLSYLLSKAREIRKTPMDLVEMRQKLEVLARYSESSVSLSAIKTLKEWLAEEKQESDKNKLLDPATLCYHLSQYDGRTAEIPQILAGIMSLIHCSPADIRAALDRADDPSPQADVHPLKESVKEDIFGPLPPPPMPKV